MDISDKIKQTFPDLAVYKSGNMDSLFGGRNLPSFVKDYIVKRFSDTAGVVDREAVRDYLDTKMTNDGGQIRQRLLRGEKVNLTCRFVVQSDLKAGKTAFNIADVDLQSDAYILPSVIESHVDDLIDGENWGNISHHESRSNRWQYQWFLGTGLRVGRLAHCILSVWRSRC